MKNTVIGGGLSVVVATLVLDVLTTKYSIRVRRSPNGRSTGCCLCSVDSSRARLRGGDCSPRRAATSCVLGSVVRQVGDRRASSRGQIDLLPRKMRVGCDMRRSILIIGFGDRCDDVDHTERLLIQTNIIGAFLRIPKVGSIHFAVRGRSLASSEKRTIKGVATSAFTRFAKARPSTCYDGAFALCFASGDNRGLMGRRHAIQCGHDVPGREVILRRLVGKPLRGKRCPAVPRGARILGIAVTSEVYCITFSKMFSSCTLSMSRGVPMCSIMGSLLSTLSTSGIRVAINKGSELSAFNGGVRLCRFCREGSGLMIGRGR